MSAYGSIENLIAEAENRFASGNFREAARFYIKLMQQTHVIDYEYDDWLRKILTCAIETGNHLAEGMIHLHFKSHDKAREKFVVASRPDLEGHALEGMLVWEEVAKTYSEASMPIHEAIALEKAGQLDLASDKWKGELSSLDKRMFPYETALFTYNLGRLLSCNENTLEQGRRVVSDALRKIETLANRFEESGERERAFDCYLILVDIGKQTPQFENLAEGYLNCIRILKEDHLVLYALQYYDDFVSIALERNEFQAAATLLQEASEYAIKNALPYGKHYVLKAGEAWLQTAAQQEELGFSEEIVENSFVAALRSFNALEHWSRIAEVLEKLLLLDLSKEKQEKYTKLANQFGKSSKQKYTPPKAPDYMKQGHAYAEIWIADSIEHELAGDPLQVAVTIVKDLKYPDLIRRRALLVALIMLDQGESKQVESSVVVEVAKLLGDLQSYTSLKPLEVLFESSDAKIRIQVMKSLRFLFFKRSFALARRGLKDPTKDVKNAALESLTNLNLQQAFNPLTRIYYEFEDLAVKKAALLAIGKIQSLESIDFLLREFKAESFGALRDSIVAALENVDNPDAGRLYQSFLSYESQNANKNVVEKLLSNIQNTL